MRDMWWQVLEFLLVFLLFLHLFIFEKVWFILMGFSCDDTCLSWIEFIFDLSMWASILVYIYGVIMEAMMMMLHNFMLWYDTLYDDNACTLYDVDALLYNMMYMHTIVWWFSYALWCILDVDDVYMVHNEMMMMYIWWWVSIPYYYDA